MEKLEYVVTELAGPKVAGMAVERGRSLFLTEAQARSELLAGAIVRKGDGKKVPAATDILAGSDKLPDIHARAVGKDAAGEPEKPAPEIKQPRGEPLSPAPERSAPAPVPAAQPAPASGPAATALKPS